jgi:hypothetical protein
MAEDEVMIQFLKGKWSFGSTFQNNMKRFGIKIKKPCDIWLHI